MTHGSLFSGIGGFDLAAEWVGWENIFHCEIEPFCQKVLKYHFPNSISYDDITKTDFSVHRGRIDIVTGGFPCQPFSLAGKRKGTEDNRYLWKEMLRAIQQIQPQWVVGENVFGIINWDGGMVFRQVQTDLETEGYEVQTYVLPACAVNAPHRRDRIWFVANALHNGNRQQGESVGTWPKRVEPEKQEGRIQHTEQPDELYKSAKCNVANPGLFGQKTGQEQTTGIEQCDEGDATDTKSGGTRGIQNTEGEARTRKSNLLLRSQCGVEDNERNVTDTQGERINRTEKSENCCGQGGERGGCNIDNNGTVRQGDGDGITPNSMCRRQPCEEHGKKKSKWTSKNGIPGNWDNFPTQPPIRGRNDGIPDRLVGITVSKHRNESIKGYGNAIVPEVALQIFKSIQEYENKFK